MGPIPRRSLLSATIISLALGWAVSGCSDNDAAGPGGGTVAAVLGTWNATTFNIPGQDLVAQGMGISFTFTSQNTWSLNIANDVGDVLCDPGPDCADGGSYSATDTQITLDPGTIDEQPLAYSIAGSVMSMSATIEGVPVTATFAKQ